MDGKQLKKILREAGVSQADLAAALGTSPQNLNSALSGDNVKSGIVEAIAQFLGKPVSYFYGEPEPDYTGAPRRVPLIPVEAHAGSLVGFADSVHEYDCEMVVSPVKDATFAIQVTGESMAPAFPNGSRILCQRVDANAFIAWGNVYLLDTINGAVLKQVRKSDTPGCVTCCSLNPAPEFSPFEVETKYIRGWYRVLMVMSLV